MSSTRKLDALQTVLLDLHDLDPVTEYRFAPPRRYRFDVALVPHLIAIEVDGATWVGGRHTTGRGHQTDSEKRNLAQTLGWRVLAYNAAMIERGDVRRDVDAVLARDHEWCHPEFHRCDGGGPGNMPVSYDDYRPSPLWQRFIDDGEIHLHEIRTAGGVKRYEVMLTNENGKGRPRKWCGTDRCHRVKVVGESG